MNRRSSGLPQSRAAVHAVTGLPGYRPPEGLLPQEIPIPPTALTLVLILALSACGSDRPPSHQITVDTLASGAVHVRNPGEGIWSQEEGRPAEGGSHLEEIIRIGRAQGDGPDVFGQIRGIEVDVHGRILVLDAMAHEVRVFNPDGSHVRTLGGPGNGPGELSGPFGLGIDGSHRVWVADSGNRRYTLWDSAGTFLETRTRPIGSWGFIWTGGFDGERLLETGIAPGPGPSGRVQALFRLSEDGAAVDTLHLPSFQAETYSIQENGLTRMSAFVPFSATQFMAVGSDSRLWLGVSSRFRIHLLDFTGDTLRIVEREHDPIPVTAAERDSALATDFLQQMRDAGGRVDPERVPPRKPAYEWFTEDDQGRLWVGVPGPAGQTGTRLDVFDPEGRYLGELIAPHRLSPWPPPTVRDGVLWAHVPDEMDVPHVIGYRVP